MRGEELLGLYDGRCWFREGGGSRKWSWIVIVNILLKVVFSFCGAERKLLVMMEQCHVYVLCLRTTVWELSLSESKPTPKDALGSVCHLLSDNKTGKMSFFYHP